MMSTREKHPKIHRIALVDNDPRALDSLSAVIASKVPTAYVVWTATSGCEAGAGDILLDSSLIPSPPIMPQDRACVDAP